MCIEGKWRRKSLCCMPFIDCALLGNFLFFFLALFALEASTLSLGYWGNNDQLFPLRSASRTGMCYLWYSSNSTDADFIQLPVIGFQDCILQFQGFESLWEQVNCSLILMVSDGVRQQLFLLTVVKHEHSCFTWRKLGN